MSPDGEPVLYGYWRSTAAYRVRIALNLKGIKYHHRGVDLVRDGGQQHGQDYRALNPTGLVPTLAIDGQLIGQSLAICEYLEETRPEPRLLPVESADRAWVRSLALDIACDIHPVNNLRVQQYLKREHGLDGEAVLAWMDHWMQLGFAAIEARLAACGSAGNCCFGDQPGLADICLVGQAYNADRFGVDLSVFTRISAIVAHCRALPQFAVAAPEAQSDAVSGSI
jgi:maleylacetoacetate isomerase